MSERNVESRKRRPSFGVVDELALGAGAAGAGIASRVPGVAFQEHLLNDLYRNKYAGKSCVVIGGGPSVSHCDVGRLGGPVVLTNAAIYLPELRPLWSSAVAGVMLDESLLLRHVGRIARDCPFPVFTGNTEGDSAAVYSMLNAIGIHRIPSNHTEGFGESFDAFCNGGNSGFAAIQLAVILGFKCIGLLGIDGVRDRAGRLRFHDDYAGRGDDDRLDSWMGEIDSLHAVFIALGVRVVNLSAISLLRRYRRVTVEQWEGIASDVETDEWYQWEADERLSREGCKGVEWPWPIMLDRVGRSGDRRAGCFGGAVNAVDPGRYVPVPRGIRHLIRTGRRGAEYWEAGPSNG